MFRDPRKWIPLALMIGGALIALTVGTTLMVQHWRNGAIQAKVNTGQAQAGTEAGVQTIRIEQDAARSRAAIDITVKDEQDGIWKAPAGDSNDDALRAACSMRSYYSVGRCAAMLQAGAGVGTAGGDAPDGTPDGREAP